MLRNKVLSLLLLMGMLTSQSLPPALAQTNCDHAQFVADVTVPDGSAFAPGAAFTKTWRLMNAGTCTWTTAYNVVWTGGEVFGAPLSTPLPAEVPPGGTVDVSVNLTAPANTTGNFKGFYKIANAAGAQFGIGDAGSDPFWVDINVVDTRAAIYDFVANAARAQWRSGAGIIPFPGTSGDRRGFGYQVDQPHLEDDTRDTAPGLLVVPQNKFNGYIQATYPEFEVQRGDRLQTLVGCEFGARNCYVTFRIDYLLPNGVQRTFWTFKEAYDGRFYRADLDLSSLAGQKVRFVFMLLSTGTASSDRAIWGSPRIVRAGTTQPPAPPPTLTPLPQLPPTPTPIGQPPPTVAPSGCDKAAFVIDATVPDGTVFSPGAAFTKGWRLRNVGTCTWTTSYKLLYFSGEQMSAPTAVNLPWNTAWGQTVDISVNMVAPTAAGKYRGYWILANASGQYFGIGPTASSPIWVDIGVAGEAPIGTGYDFTSNVCSAEWRSSVGVLPCPGAEGASSGFVIKQDAPKMEDGSAGAPGLLAVPQNRYNGYIQGFYPTFTVRPGDKFQATVGCEQGAACYLTYRLDYVTAAGYLGTFWTWREQNEGKIYNADIDLTPLAGRSVRFVLTILAAGYATNDRAIWGSPRITRAGGAPPVTVTPPTLTPVPPTLTPVPPANDWLTYNNTAFGFHFKYPPQGQISEEDFNALRMDLPFTQGTNLREKYLEMRAVEGADPCQSPLATSSMLSTSENVVINGITFLKQTGGDAGAGNIHEWIAYSTLKGSLCISMDFILHSLNAGNFPTPPPVFDKAAEAQLFTQMMSTFGFAAQPTDWSTYTNSTYGFQFNYPPGSERHFETPSSILIRLPIAPGTNLVEKYLNLLVLDNYETCMLIEDGSNRELVVINGITFVKETGDSQGAGQTRITTTYYTERGNVCVTFPFVLHSGNPDNYDPPKPVYDEAAESAVFMQIMSSFAWTAAPGPTATFTPSPMLPDLTIGGMFIQLQNPGCLMPGDPLGVRIGITNNGQAAAGSFVVRVNGADQGISGLGVGETIVLFFPSYMNPVSATVDATNAVPESDENNNARSEMVPVPTPPLPCDTPTPTLTPTPSAATGPYAVVRVPPGYMLNIHSAAGNSQPIVGSLQPEAVNVMRTGAAASAEDATWWEVQNPSGGTGWVLAYHLTEYVSHDAFCADARLPVLIEQLKGSLNQSNGDMFAGLVSPSHGTNVHLWAYQPPVTFTAATARNVFTSTESYNWGSGPRGEPDMGTFKDVIQPKLLEVVNAPNMETYCDNLTKVYPLAAPWPYPNIRYYNLYKPATPGNDFDFRTWLVGFEYVNGQPYLHALVSIVWEP
ncbi:MAG: NBR1-Ig-like domain-containing protein [Anaerolineales bacterium]